MKKILTLLTIFMMALTASAADLLTELTTALGSDIFTNAGSSQIMVNADGNVVFVNGEKTVVLNQEYTIRKSASRYYFEDHGSTMFVFQVDAESGKVVRIRDNSFASWFEKTKMEASLALEAELVELLGTDMYGLREDSYPFPVGLISVSDGHVYISEGPMFLKATNASLIEKDGDVYKIGEILISTVNGAIDKVVADGDMEFQKIPEDESLASPLEAELVALMGSNEYAASEAISAPLGEISIRVFNGMVCMVNNVNGYEMIVAEGMLASVSKSDANYVFTVSNGDGSDELIFVVEDDQITKIEISGSSVVFLPKEQPSTPTAIKDINAGSEKAVKTIENGKVVIIRDGVKYDLSGRAVK